MLTTIRVGFVVTALLVLSNSPASDAQESTSPAGEWQGARPTPQQEHPAPAPQSAVPPSRQVLEIPAQSQQQGTSSISRQQSGPPRHSQQRSRRRPDQLITVTVTDQNGGYIPGLQPSDFVVYEGGIPQDITYFNTGANEPISLGLIVDTSGSMRNKIDRARHALQRFIQSIKPQDEIFLEEFNVQPMLLQDFTDSRTLLSQGLSMLRPAGGTSLYDAILDGLRRVKRGRHQKKALIVMTDGMDTASLSSLNQTLNVARRSGVLIYTIGIGNPQRHGPRGGTGFSIGPFGVIVGGGDERVDSRTLRIISEESGGKHFLLNTGDVVGSRAVLDKATQTISHELRFQYSLGYASTGQGKRDYRSIRVETLRDDVIVRAQKGYASD